MRVPNKSVETNRRPACPFDVGRQFGRAPCAAPRRLAAVAQLGVVDMAARPPNRIYEVSDVQWNRPLSSADRLHGGLRRTVSALQWDWR